MSSKRSKKKKKSKVVNRTQNPSGRQRQFNELFPREISPNEMSLILEGSLEKLLEASFINKTPTAHWYDIDMCFCDSGKLFSDCHMKLMYGKKLAGNLPKSEVYKLMNKDYNVKCQVNGCTNAPINSHVAPANILKKIQLNFKNIMINPMGERQQGYKKISWPIFCKFHDYEIFKDVDISPFELTNENLIKSLVRPMYQELVDKESVYLMVKAMFNADYKYATNHKLIDQYKGNMLGARDIRHNIKSAINGDIEIHHFIIKSNYKVCAWASFNKKTSSRNKKPLYIDPVTMSEYEKMIYPMVTSYVIPWENDSLLLCIGLIKSNYLSDEIELFNTLTENQKIQYILASLTSGSNFWCDDELYRIIDKNGYRKKFQFDVLGNVLAHNEVHFTEMNDIFDLLFN